MGSFIAASGIRSFQKLTNLAVTKIEKLYRNCEADVNERFNIGRKEFLNLLNRTFYS